MTFSAHHLSGYLKREGEAPAEPLQRLMFSDLRGSAGASSSRFTGSRIASRSLAVCLWLNLAAANQLAADPSSLQPIEAVPQSHREPERPFPKPKRNDQLEELQKQQMEIHVMLEKGQENLKKLDETIKKREQEEADRAKTIAEQNEARFARGSVSRLVLIGVVGLLILAYRTFKSPEH